MSYCSYLNLDNYSAGYELNPFNKPYVPPVMTNALLTLPIGTPIPDFTQTPDYTQMMTPYVSSPLTGSLFSNSFEQSNLGFASNNDSFGIFGNLTGRTPLSNLSTLFTVSAKTKTQAKTNTNTAVDTDFDLSSDNNGKVKKRLEAIAHEKASLYGRDYKTVLSIVTTAYNKAKQYGVDPRFVLAVVEQESTFDPKAKSYAGALGAMQLMPATAKGLGVKDPLNIEQNIDGGVRLLKQYSTKYNGDKELILAAYNAGPEAVKKYNGVPNYKQTKKYIAEITSKYTNYSTDLIA
jgi:hypothetical protein